MNDNLDFDVHQNGNTLVYSGLISSNEDTKLNIKPNKYIQSLKINDNKINLDYIDLNINLTKDLNTINYTCNNTNDPSLCKILVEKHTTNDFVNQFKITSDGQKGMMVLLYDNPDFRGDPIKQWYKNDFNISEFQNQTHFSLKFFGTFNTDKSREYLFELTSDDGSELYIDNKKIIDNSGYHEKRSISAKISLEEGNHSFIVNYNQGSGNLDLQLKVKESCFEDISNIYSIFKQDKTKNGLSACIYPLDKEKLSPITCFDIYNQDFNNLTSYNNVRIEINGKLKIYEEGFYNFKFNSNKDILLFLNDIPVCVNTKPEYQNVYEQIYLLKGLYNFKISQYKLYDGPLISLEWKPEYYKDYFVIPDVFIETSSINAF